GPRCAARAQIREVLTVLRVPSSCIDGARRNVSGARPYARARRTEQRPCLSLSDDGACRPLQTIRRNESGPTDPRRGPRRTELRNQKEDRELRPPEPLRPGREDWLVSVGGPRGQSAHQYGTPERGVLDGAAAHDAPRRPDPRAASRHAVGR